MASALWLGSMEPQQLTSFLSLPVQVLVTSQSVQPRFAGQRFLTPTGDRKALLSALQDRDIYFLSVADWSPVVLPSRHGRLLALGQVPPPTGSPIAFQSVLPQEQYAALCRLLPLAEPETLYINGGEVRCSVVEEDYLPLLERLGSL